MEEVHGRDLSSENVGLLSHAFGRKLQRKMTADFATAAYVEMIIIFAFELDSYCCNTSKNINWIDHRGGSPTGSWFHSMLDLNVCKVRDWCKERGRIFMPH